MKYLIHLSLTVGGEGIVEQIAKSAACFLETQGAVERSVLGTFVREGRTPKTTEALHLFLLTVTGGAASAPPNARLLEGVLRSTLGVTRAANGELLVYVEAR